MFFILILFMVSVDTWFNENLLLILNFYYCFYTLVTNYLIMKLIASFPNDIEVSSAQLKRLDESVVDPKCLLKVSVTSFCFLIKIHHFQATYFLVYYYFYLRDTVYMLSKMDWNYHQHYFFSKYNNLAYLFRFATGFCCDLNLKMSLGFFDLFELFLRVIWLLFAPEDSEDYLILS